MYPDIRLYVQEKPNIDAISLPEANMKGCASSNTNLTIFPNKKNNFDLHVGYDETLSRLFDVMVTKHPEVERRDGSALIGENPFTETCMELGKSIPLWFRLKIEKDNGVLRLDEMAYDAFMSSSSFEQEGLNEMMKFIDVANYGDVLMRTKGKASYVAHLLPSGNSPSALMFSSIGHVANSLMKYNGFMSVNDVILEDMYITEKFEWEPHFDTYRTYMRKHKLTENKEKWWKDKGCD